MTFKIWCKKCSDKVTHSLYHKRQNSLCVEMVFLVCWVCLAILKHCTEKMPLDSDVSLEGLSKQAYFYRGADLENLFIQVKGQKNKRFEMNTELQPNVALQLPLFLFCFVFSFIRHFFDSSLTLPKYGSLQPTNIVTALSQCSLPKVQA